MKEHKHAAILRALADGHEIQWRSAGGWNELDSAAVICGMVEATSGFDFRIKPEKKWYRVAALKSQAASWIDMVTSQESEDRFARNAAFDRWLTDRIYYE